MLFRKNLFHNKDYGKVIVKEVIPIFHNQSQTANKTVYIFNKALDENKAEFVQGYSKITKIYHSNEFITQNGVPIKIYDDRFSRGKFDLEFKKEGYEVGKIYSFKGLGYLGNLNTSCKVKLVTDQYVIFDTANNISFYSYNELKKIVKEEIA